MYAYHARPPPPTTHHLQFHESAGSSPEPDWLPLATQKNSMHKKQSHITVCTYRKTTHCTVENIF